MIHWQRSFITGLLLAFVSSGQARGGVSDAEWQQSYKQYCTAHRLSCPTVPDAAAKDAFVLVVHDAVAHRKPTPTAGQVQPANNSPPATQGSPAQTEAVPAVKPTTQTGANAALAGTRGGLRIVGSGAVNPATLLADGSGQDAVRSISIASRVFDLGVSFSVNPTGSTSVTDAFDYVGVRLRVDLVGGSAGNKLYDKAAALSLEAFSAALVADSQLDQEIESALMSASDRMACAESIATADNTKIQAACGRGISVFPAFEDAQLAFWQRFVDARNQADRAYLGLDARYDHGDPSISGHSELRGEYLLVGVAGGIQKNIKKGFIGVRARLGVSYSNTNHGTDTTTSFDWGGAIAAGIVNDLRVTQFSAGFEGRSTRGSDDNADTNFIDFKLGLDIPLSDGTRLGAGLSLPVQGNHGTIISLSGNWSALFPASRP